MSAARSSRTTRMTFRIRTCGIRWFKRRCTLQFPWFRLARQDSAKVATVASSNPAQALNLRPSGYEGDFTQPADGRRPSCFQSSRVVSSSAKSTEGHAGIRKSPPVWTRFGQSSGEPLRTGDLRLGNSEGLDSRTSTALHSEPKASISLETVARPDPRIFHTAPQKHESLGPTGGPRRSVSVAAAAQQLGVCTATVYTLCARGQLPHVRILNAIRIAQTDLKAFVVARRVRTRDR